jgi:nucleotidyltransferase substrate binding protein (TIGR01987 family)
VIEQAFADGVIQDGELWMSMLKSRNETVHTYDAELVQEILADIRREYFVALQDFAQTFTRITTHDR